MISHAILERDRSRDERLGLPCMIYQHPVSFESFLCLLYPPSPSEKARSSYLLQLRSRLVCVNHKDVPCPLVGERFAEAQVFVVPWVAVQRLLDGRLGLVSIARLAAILPDRDLRLALLRFDLGSIAKGQPPWAARRLHALLLVSTLVSVIPRPLGLGKYVCVRDRR